MVVYEYEWFLESLSFLQAFLPNVANKEVGITQLANINQHQCQPVWSEHWAMFAQEYSPVIDTELF